MHLIRLLKDKGSFKKGEHITATQAELKQAGWANGEDFEFRGTYGSNPPASKLAPLLNTTPEAAAKPDTTPSKKSK